MPLASNGDGAPQFYLHSQKYVLSRLVTRYGGKNWIKREGTALVELEGQTARAEVHWYECRGIGKVKMKVKQWL